MASAVECGTSTEMAAFIAHEIAGALAAIVNNAAAAELLLDRDTPELEEARAVARAIYSDAMRAADIVRGVRALLSPGVPEEAPIDLRVVVDAAVGLLRFRAADAQVQLTVVAADDLPVLGDARQLQQVVLNLCRNAIDAMAGSDGASRQLVIRAATHGSLAVVEVGDTGPGFSAEALERAYDLFFTTKRKRGGMGVGLALARRIAEAHRGSLRIANKPEGGACVTLALPLDARARNRTPASAEVSPREKMALVVRPTAPAPAAPATVFRIVLPTGRFASSA